MSETTKRGSELQPLTTIEEKPRVWLWPGYLEANKLHHFGGASSQGKSPVTLDLVARMTSGSDWPDGAKNDGARSAIVLAGEDDWSSDIKPRLRLAGANLKRVFKFVSMLKVDGEEHVTFTDLSKDIEELAAHIKSRGDVGLVVIDPITNYLGNKNMNDETDVRSILMPLSNLAQAFGCCVVTVGHLNKRGSDATPMQRLMGAGAFGGVARVVLMFGDDPNSDDKFSHVMGFGRTVGTPPLRYRTVSKEMSVGGRPSEVIGIEWRGVAADVDMDEVVNARKQREKTIEEEASAFIRTFLADGAKPTKLILDAMNDAGIEYDSQHFSRPANKAGARSRKSKIKNGGWEWYLVSEQDKITFDVDNKGATQ
jgi:putative DNA primase/helicase